MLRRIGLHRLASTSSVAGAAAMLALGACSDAASRNVAVHVARGSREPSSEPRPAVANALRPESPAV
ncbi:MAG TPA: hypothetical protein VFJ16_16010, partial [Longimicrobium sp.]|nr:hypothetical protein [Longimicrobium sp.]